MPPEFLSWWKSCVLGTLSRDLCKVTPGFGTKSTISGNSIGDWFVGEAADTGPWLGEWIGFKLAKTPEKVKKWFRQVNMYVCIRIHCISLCFNEYFPPLEKIKYP